ncbi:hypothetical protein EV679_2171 [Kerstersia gyiorum]|uniref:HphA N-terminal heme-binding domain-containing protein n=1 Tax=Kerstersia gyiorum TaxID=206506 RepID=A0A4Q7MRZ1_9BURK|nr:Slam-dependent surface lipoprotein [Kerstersia gyiorum]KAB0544435.1 hypothetical protein F7P85_03075 [Kerstersia gyiorum]RZS69569.1 hypothetical protein EV679_2171 [Kerstersia gyiorum]
MEKTMNLQKLALASALALASITSFAAPVAGKSSNENYIKVGSSTFQGNNEAGIGFPTTNPPDGTTAALSSLKNGPILQTDNAYTTQAGPDYFIEFNVSGSTLRMAQTWRNLSAPNGTEIYTWRQISDPVGADRPHFGNTSIAKVSGHEVYFGEWVPKATSPVYGSSTNMVGQNDSLRTVFFVGENPTTSMPTLVNAKYDVVGLRQYNPGTQAGVYTGVLTANYGGGKASLTGNVGYVSFANTAISADGTFQNNNGSIQGRFYGANASALAGYYKDANSAADHMAFGGAKR